MWFQIWRDLLPSLRQPRARHRQRLTERNHRRRRRLLAEGLEDRRLLAMLPAVHYDAGDNPGAIVTADFNGDQLLDLAVANSSNGSVNVLLGNADGTFQPAQTSAAGSYPISIAAGDFDKDGKLDLAAVNGFGGAYDYGYGGIDSVVSVMFGNGDGAFQPPSNIILHPKERPQSVAVGDFNGDGTMDLAVASSVDPYYPGDYYPDSGQASVILAKENRSFEAPKNAFAGWNGANSAVVADFNGDTKLDLAVGDAYQQSVTMLLGDGGGNLAYNGINWLIDHGTSLAAGDVDGDLDADLVSADGFDVNVRLGNGLGGFSSPAQSYAAGSQPFSAVLGDFSRDGKLDIATANWGGDNVSILLGFGNGAFNAPEHFAAGPDAYAVAAGDFNGDGWLDVATANANGNTVNANSVSVLLNNQTWQPLPPPVLISVTDASVTEGRRGIKYLTFTVSLSAPSNAPVTVQFATQGGTATVGSDYQAQNGTLTFAAGETSKTVTIAIIGDNTVEVDEYFQLLLSNVSGNALLNDPLGVGTILNDDKGRGGGIKRFGGNT